jgi:hypothetical protein
MLNANADGWGRVLERVASRASGIRYPARRSGWHKAFERMEDAARELSGRVGDG